MTKKRASCPYLPPAKPKMDWRCLHRFGKFRGIDFYLTALQYAQYLWEKGFSARSVLALDRALYSDLKGDEEALKRWPLPYRPMQWFFQHHPKEAFIGNPRVSFQHLAGRVQGERVEQRRWRAWACWYIARQCFPEMEPDRRHAIAEPSRAEIERNLQIYGLPQEPLWWLQVIELGPLVEATSW